MLLQVRASCVAMILVVENIDGKNYCWSASQAGLVLEEKVTAPSIKKLDNRVEFRLGFLDELLRTSLMVVWELMKPSWCSSQMLIRYC